MYTIKVWCAYLSIMYTIKVSVYSWLCSALSSFYIAFHIIISLQPSPALARHLENLHQTNKRWVFLNLSGCHLQQRLLVRVLISHQCILYLCSLMFWIFRHNKNKAVKLEFMMRFHYCQVFPMSPFTSRMLPSLHTLSQDLPSWVHLKEVLPCLFTTSNIQMFQKLCSNSLHVSCW